MINQHLSYQPILRTGRSAAHSTFVSWKINTFFNTATKSVNCCFQIQDWKKCQALCNTIELRRRVERFDIRSVPLDDAVKAINILNPMKVDEVRAISLEVATFYVWVCFDYQLLFALEFENVVINKYEHFSALIC